MDVNATSPPDQNVSTVVRRAPPKRSRVSQSSATCTFCRRRKVRCDRGFPCGTCKRSGEQCIPTVPSHAPRGRQGGRKPKTDGELLGRIARLEELLHDVAGDSDGPKTDPLHVYGTPATGPSDGSHQDIVYDASGPLKETGNEEVVGHKGQNHGSGLERYLGSPLWVTLSEEISGLKDVLNESSDPDDEAEELHTPGSSLPSPGQKAHDSRFIISPSFLGEGPASASTHQLYIFCDVYLSNVDTVLKVLHAPSLRRYLQDGAAELDCSPGARGLEALKFAISYVSTISMTDDECKYRIGEGREVLMAKYRAGTELALAKADLVNTAEISTLQAMVIYLVAVRVNDTRRVMWTLTSLALRIAQAIGLHLESSSALRPFEREMRRRLWWQICLLDYHGAADRATNPLITADSFNTKPPLHLDDQDLSVDSIVDVKERQGFTDMTFSLVCCEIMDTSSQLNYVPVRKLSRFSESHGTWAQRVDAVVDLQRNIDEKYLCHLNVARPFHWATRLVADIMTATIWLVVYRPLQQHPNNRPSQLGANPDILGLSVDVLERGHALNKDPAASSFRWLAQTYVHWHALAVTVAELCVKTEGPMVERAWAILMLAFNEASQQVADSQEGMLWRPIKKLMNKAQQVRRDYLGSRSAIGDQIKRGARSNLFDISSNGIGEGGSNLDIQGVEEVSPLMNKVQIAPATGPVPFNWDSWLNTTNTPAESSMGGQLEHDINQIAWTNWEAFIDGFQGHGEAMRAELSSKPSAFPSTWP